MNIRLSKKNKAPTRKGKYIDRKIARQLIEIGRGKRAFKEGKYGKAIQYLERRALHPNATEGVKYIVGASYTEIKVHEKEASDLLKSIIQKYKDEPKESRPEVYTGAILEYAKIQIRNELTEFAIYLLEDISAEDHKYSVDVLTELGKAYDMQAQELRGKDKNEEALEAERKAEKTCLKCKEISEKDTKFLKKSITARNLLGILYVRQGRIAMAEAEFNKIVEINPKSKKTLGSMESMHLLKETYFKEETEEEANKRIKKLEKKLEAIENGEEVEKKEYARELNLISRSEYYEELSPDLKVYKGIDVFTGYKMYEYPLKGVCVIDKVFNEIKDEKKIYGATYVFPLTIEFNSEKLSRFEVIRMLDTELSVQKQEHRGDYYNLIQEKMKRAELEGLVIEEKELKEKEKELEEATRKSELEEKNEKGE